MHDPEDFQKQTIKAISDLHDMFGQLKSSHLAVSALARALLSRVPLESLPAVLEEYETEVDNQASQVLPQFQHREAWLQWSTLITRRQEHLQRLRDQQSPSA